MDIRDYRLIGDLHTSALVSKRGSIDFMCAPHFDSGTIFAKILDRKAGSFTIRARAKKSGYLPGTAIVETEFEGFTVRDFMVPRPTTKCDTHILVRKFFCTSERARIKLEFNPKPDFGREKLHMETKAGLLVADIGKHALILRFPENTQISRRRGFELEFEIDGGSTAEVILEYVDRTEDIPKQGDFEEITRKFWEEWVSKGNFFDFCKPHMIRSAITLKLMQYYPTGAIIASPTTSLPEEIGGIRNWDYRYVWIRDATFTLYALYVLGFNEEAEKFFTFIEEKAVRLEKRKVKINLMYTIEGKALHGEEELKHLRGYKNSRPVRIGNGASEQFQLDIYGSLIDAYYFMEKKGIKITESKKEIVMHLVQKIKDSWTEKDNGIWEVRDERQNFTYSKVMAWVGVNRALRMSETLNIPKEKKQEWEKLELEIKEWIWDNCYDKEKQLFRQYPSTSHQDATNFLFVMLQFLDKNEAKTEAIIENTIKELCYNDVFVYRYLNQDGLEGKEGAFLLCSFWMISALAMTGKVERAKGLFRKLEKKLARNKLMSEEIDPKTSDYLGNYPQAFSHIGYVMAAYYIDRYMSKIKKGKRNLLKQ